MLYLTFSGCVYIELKHLITIWYYCHTQKGVADERLMAIFFQQSQGSSNIWIQLKKNDLSILHMYSWPVSFPVHFPVGGGTYLSEGQYYVTMSELLWPAPLIPRQFEHSPYCTELLNCFVMPAVSPRLIEFVSDIICCRSQCKGMSVEIGEGCVCKLFFSAVLLQLPR